jgi:CheY-like chemotaxis protein
MDKITTGLLRSMRVLIVEDEHLVALALADDLEEAGAIVVGPAATVGGALDLVQQHELDAAVLDIRLNKQFVFPVADTLMERGVPFLFTTGYDADMLPSDYAHVPKCEKPASASTVLDILASLRN